MKRDSATEADLLANALHSAEKLVAQVRSDGLAISARPDRERWQEGTRRLAGVRAAAETLAKQILSTPEQP